MARSEPKSGKDVRLSQSHIQDLLDEAFTESFPASDPIAVDSAEKKWTSTQISDDSPDGDERAAAEIAMSPGIRNRRASAR